MGYQTARQFQQQKRMSVKCYFVHNILCNFYILSVPCPPVFITCFHIIQAMILSLLYVFEAYLRNLSILSIYIGLSFNYSCTESWGIIC